MKIHAAQTAFRRPRLHARIWLLVWIVIFIVGCGVRTTETSTPVQTDEPVPATEPSEPAVTKVPALTPENPYVEPTNTSEASFLEPETPLGGGGRIIFSSEREEKYSYDLYWMLPDGSEVTRITETSEESELSANWSPDGYQVVFESRSPARSSFLYIMDIDSGERTIILKSNRYAGGPDWTKAGIVYYEGRCTIESCWSEVDKMTTEIYVIQPDGSGRTPLTFTPHRTLGPSWSPDFEQIVYTYGTSQTLHIMNADGSDQNALIAILGDALDPVWSPDGEWIAFATNRHDRFELYMVRPDGTDLTRLTDDPHNDEHPAWSPDGKYIAFSTERYGDSEICILEVATGEVTRLTNSPLRDIMPDWSP